MNQQERIIHYLAHLDDLPGNRDLLAPPLCRWLWRRGRWVTPPIFQPFGHAFLFFGVPYGLGIGLLFLVLGSVTGRTTAGHAVLAAAVSGLLFGGIMAGLYRLLARRWKLPAWESYPAGGNDLTEPTGADHPSRAASR